LQTPRRLLLAALLFGLITVVALNAYLDKAVSVALPAKEIQYIQVVTARKSIPAYAKITEEMLFMKALPSEAVHPEALTNLQDALGAVSRADIVKGEQILASRIVSEKNAATLAFRLPEKMRAISIPVNEVTGVSGFISPGNRVDVLVTYSDEEINEVTTTYTILQNALVMAVGEHTRENEGEERKLVSTVTLAVTPGQAEVLAHALVKGTFHLTLRSSLDEEIVKLDYFSAENFNSFRQR